MGDYPVYREDKKGFLRRWTPPKPEPSRIILTPREDIVYVIERHTDTIAYLKLDTSVGRARLEWINCESEATHFACKRSAKDTMLFLIASDIVPTGTDRSYHIGTCDRAQHGREEPE